MRAILEDNIRVRNQAEQRFQTFFEREVHQLHNSVRTESEVRRGEIRLYINVFVCQYTVIARCGHFIVKRCFAESLPLFASQVREREDDEIVEALNKYTVKLQTSLKLINSTDM